MTEPTATPAGTLDRKAVVPALVGDHRDFLIVSGLAGTSRDMAALTGDGDHLFTMAGAMGAAAPLGLGLALGRPERQVLVVTGDGELLMNVGALATIAAQNPPNLSILVVDNARYGETGHQPSHTAYGTDLAAMATGAGIATVRDVRTEADVAEGARALRESNGTSLVVAHVAPSDPPAVKRLLDPAAARLRFRNALAGTD